MSLVLKSFDVSNITFKKPERVGKNSFMCKLHYEKQKRIIFQTPKLHVPYVPTVYRHKNFVFYKLCLEADRLKFDKSVQQLFKQIEHIDRFIKSRASMLWEKIGYSKRGKKFKNSVFYNDEKTRGYLYTSIQVYQRKPVLSIFDAYKEPQGYDYLIPESRAYSLIWLDNVWMKSNKMGLNWVVLQMKVYLPIYKLDFCFIEEPDTTASDAGVALYKHPVYQKYFKMKKMGVPVASIQHKLRMDGLDASIILKNETDTVPLPSSVMGTNVKCERTTTTEMESVNPQSAPIGGLMGVLSGLRSVKLKKTKPVPKPTFKPVTFSAGNNRAPSLDAILSQLKNLKKINKTHIH